MKNFEIEWQYCLPVWMGHTFPNSVKRGIMEILAKNEKEAVSKFRELRSFQEDTQGYYRVNSVTVKEN